MEYLYLIYCFSRIKTHNYSLYERDIQKMKKFLLTAVEDYISKRSSQIGGFSLNVTTAKISNPAISAGIRERLSLSEKEKSLYDVIVEHINKLNNRDFYRKNGELNEAAFYKYAFIDKSTWSSLRWGLIKLKKKTLLKLVIALKLNEDDAVDLMHRGSNSFDPKDKRDQIILALINLRVYDPVDVYEVLEEYRLNGYPEIENIYD